MACGYNFLLLYGFITVTPVFNDYPMMNNMGRILYVLL